MTRAKRWAFGAGAGAGLIGMSAALPVAAQSF